MHQILTVSLDNTAYSIVEDGYRSLRQYLDNARAGLREDPDVVEILADLERSISEKCRNIMQAGQTLIGVQDVQRILAEMGPVGDAPLSGASLYTGPADEPQEMGRSRRLRRRHRGGVIAGVCCGLAEYLHLDVVIIRLAFVGLAACAGFGVVLYCALTVLMPSDRAGEGLYRRMLPAVFSATMLISLALSFQVLRVGFNELFFIGLTVAVPMGIIIVLGLVVMVGLKVLRSGTDFIISSGTGDRRTDDGRTCGNRP